MPNEVVRHAERIVVGRRGIRVDGADDLAGRRSSPRRGPWRSATRARCRWLPGRPPTRRAGSRRPTSSVLPKSNEPLAPMAAGLGRSIVAGALSRQVLVHRAQRELREIERGHARRHFGRNERIAGLDRDRGVVFLGAAPVVVLVVRPHALHVDLDAIGQLEARARERVLRLLLPTSGRSRDRCHGWWRSASRRRSCPDRDAEGRS